MRLLRRVAPDGSTKAVAVFGLGLVGRTIADALERRSGFRSISFPFDWNDAAIRRKQVGRLQGEILQQAGLSRLDIVWAAGKAGFAATAAELDAEFKSFADVISLSEILADRLPDAKHHFHLMSSAGGLFEGQRLVEGATVPAPRRPYGESKLRQEERCRQMRSEVSVSIYRPSTVYGYSGANGRVGLITVLLDNARKHRPSRLFGNSNTVRDYLYVGDIGNFLADRVNAAIAPPGTFLLASGKATAMHEVLHIVQRVVGKRPYTRFDPHPSNADHMSFRPSALPRGWKSTDLETGIRQTARQLLYSFASGSAI